MRAREIAQRLGGSKHSGKGWMCKCPIHDDHTPSLFVCDDAIGIRNHCHYGCAAKLVHEYFLNRGWIDMKETMPENIDVPMPDKNAQAIWNACISPLGTPAELYLVNRGFDGAIPPSLRYHPSLSNPHDPRKFPVLVAAVQQYPNPEVFAIHRHYLTEDGCKADIKTPKAMLGKVKGGAVRLSPLQEILAVCEGVETGLSILQYTGMAVWCALSAGGLENLIVPMGVKSVIIFADNDENNVGLDAAKTLCLKLRKEKKTVNIRIPPEEGTDYNDYFANHA